MSTSNVTSVRIRPATFEDYPAISALMQRYKLDTKKKDEWRFLWEGNPEFQRIGAEWPIGWVLEGMGDQIVGFFGNIPIAYEFRGRHLTAAATHAWVVDVAYRRSTILLIHRYFSQKIAHLLVNASANHEAGKIFTAMHGHPTPSPRSDVALFWVTDHPEFMSSLLRSKGSPDLRVLRNLSGGLLWALTQAKRLRWRPGKDVSHSKADIHFVPGFDERFDEFWNRLRVGGDLIRCLRDRQTLAWHFRYALMKGEAWILIGLADSTICAYSIFLRQDNSTLGLRRVRLVDFQALPGRENLLVHMVSAALVRCRVEGLHMLESVGFGGVTRSLLEAHAPYRRQLPAWMFFYKARDTQLDQELSRAARWDVCSYDGDGSL